MNIDRVQFLEELKLREYIRKGIQIVVEKRQQNKNTLSEEVKLRKVIRELIQEVAIDDNEPSPHQSTGINVLEDLLKKIVPVLEIDFKKLTTSLEQRQSFRAHIINAVENTLAPSKIVSNPSLEEDVSINVDDEDAFIPIDDKYKSETEQEEPEDPRDTFGVSGADTTGRNVAYESFKKIEAGIVDSYDVLASEEDRELFYDYLITNLKLYFDKFEDDLSTKLSEPTTDEYEAQKQNALA
tara:strand:+ start:185 stop:904 length:720 start_codon:yes stop_codon:yes gene_type:complete